MTMARATRMRGFVQFAVIDPCDLRHGRAWLLLVNLLFFFLVGQELFGQPPKAEAVPPIPAPRVLLELAEDVTVFEDAAQVDPNLMNQDKLKVSLLQLMRGLIQNELNVVDTVCKLTTAQKQVLVDSAERDWQAKSSASISKCTQQQMFGIVDLDALAERLVKGWLQSNAPPEQLAEYEKELASRMQYRKQALISRVLDSLEPKLQLTSSQMQRIEEVLNREWRDRWYRSMEATFTNTALHPEIRLRWIESILTDSQQAALASRENQAMFASFRVSADSPSVTLETRLTIGMVASSESIEIGAKVDGEQEGRARIRDALQLADPVEDFLNVPK
jgi:hypothetical protein